MCWCFIHYLPTTLQQPKMLSPEDRLKVCDLCLTDRPTLIATTKLNLSLNTLNCRRQHNLVTKVHFDTNQATGNVQWRLSKWKWCDKQWRMFYWRIINKISTRWLEHIVYWQSLINIASMSEQCCPWPDFANKWIGYFGFRIYICHFRKYDNNTYIICVKIFFYCLHKTLSTRGYRLHQRYPCACLSFFPNFTTPFKLWKLL